MSSLFMDRRNRSSDKIYQSGPKELFISLNCLLKGHFPGRVEQNDPDTINHVFLLFLSTVKVLFVLIYAFI